MQRSAALWLVALLAPAARAELPVPLKRTALVAVPASTYTRCPLSRIATDHETVMVPAFYLESDEVTQRQYDACVAAGVCKEPLYRWPHPDQPVTGVSWYDADTYCRFIGRRLPGFAEWWRALYPPDARRVVDLPDSITDLREGSMCASLVIHSAGRTVCGFYTQPGIVLRMRERLEQAAVDAIESRYGGVVQPQEEARDYVRTQPEPIRDLIGNVSEWVADWAPDLLKEEGWLTPRRDPRPQPSSFDRKMALGGNFLRMPIPTECGGTAFYEPGQRRKEVGFRCAADQSDPEDERPPPQLGAANDGGTGAAVRTSPAVPARAADPGSLRTAGRLLFLLPLPLPLLGVFYLWRRRRTRTMAPGRPDPAGVGRPSP